MTWYNLGPLPHDGSQHPQMGPDHDAEMTSMKDQSDCVAAQYENLPQPPDLIDAELSSEHPSTLYRCTEYTLPCPQPQVREHMRLLNHGPIPSQGGIYLTLINL